MKKAVFSKLASSKAFYAQARELMPKIELTEVEGFVFDLMEDFFKSYQRIPTREEMLLQLSALPEAERQYIRDYREFVLAIYVPTNVEERYLMDQLIEMAAKNQLRHGITAIAKTFDTKAAKDVERDIQGLIMRSYGQRDRRVENFE